MSSMKQYGHYWIAASIAVTGVVWLFRPGDTRIKGEDYAALFETAQNVLVIPYLTGDQVPDWEDANTSGGNSLYASNSIYSVIRYSDIVKMANRSRNVVMKDDGAIFWTNAEFTNTVELAVSYGGVCDTQLTAGVTVDTLNGGGWTVTNRTYSFSTNTFADTIVTTATRMWQADSIFEGVVPVDSGSALSYENPSYTNLPMANLVYGRGSAIGLTNSSGFQTPGSWWPYTRSYAYPWEQWNTPERSRIVALVSASEGVSLADKLTWISSNSLDVVYGLSTNETGYVMGRLMDLNGNRSPEWLVVKTPTNYAMFSIEGPSTPMGPQGYVYNMPYSLGWHLYINLYLANNGSQITLDIQQLEGDQVNSGGGQSGLRVYDPVRGAYVRKSIIEFYDQGFTTNSLIVLKVSAPSGYGVAPVYFGINLYSGADLKTNIHFALQAVAMSNQVTATASESALADPFAAIDDERITTNKLNQLAEVLTNLNRTVYIGTYEILTATNQQKVVQGDNVSTNYPDEWIYNQAGETPTYYSGYDRDAQIDELLGVAVATTNSVAVNTARLEEGLFEYWLEGSASIYSNSVPALEYDSVVNGYGRFNRSKYSQTGCSVTYPSLWAITNGYVKRVQVYVAAECIPDLDQPYINDDITTVDMYSHNAGGEYWNQGNYGITWSNGVLNTPSVAIEFGRTTGVHRVYNGLQGNFRLTDKAVFTRIYDVSNPTNAISFDLPEIQTSLPDLKARHAYLDWKTAPSGERWEGWYYDHSVGWEIRISRVMIVVDWELDGMLKE